MRKKIFAASMSLLLLAGSFTTAYAYVSKSGLQYQNVTHMNIPSYGKTSYNTYYGSKKEKSAMLATFKATEIQALLGNFAMLIDQNKNAKSIEVGLKKGQAKATSEIGCKVGNVYFSAVMSSGFEPSNTCDVKMGFSADNLLTN